MTRNALISSATAAVLDLLVRRDEAQDLIEYALLAALIVVVTVGAVTSAGQIIGDVFWTTISKGLNGL